jgi:hypothetical protein
LTSIAIPASSRPVFAAIEKARACLIRRGVRVSGGPSPGDPHPDPQTPIGELLIVNGNAQIFTGFYKDSRIARQFEPTAIENAKRLGGGAARRGAVMVLWTHSPPSDQRNAAQACAFG